MFWVQVPLNLRFLLHPLPSPEQAPCSAPVLRWATWVAKWVKTPGKFSCFPEVGISLFPRKKKSCYTCKARTGTRLLREKEIGTGAHCMWICREQECLYPQRVRAHPERGACRGGAGSLLLSQVGNVSASCSGSCLFTGWSREGYLTTWSRSWQETGRGKGKAFLNPGCTLKPPRELSKIWCLGPTQGQLNWKVKALGTVFLEKLLSVVWILIWTN